MGQRASQVSTLFFHDVELPEDALLGEEGAGFRQMMQALDKGRVRDRRAGDRHLPGRAQRLDRDAKITQI